MAETMMKEVLGYKECEELAQEMNKIVRKYFDDCGTGRTEPAVSYFKYDLKKYTFRIICTTLNRREDTRLKYDKSMYDFRKEMRAFLKSQGFSKMKVDTKKITVVGGAFGDYQVTRLNAIYFDV